MKQVWWLIGLGVVVLVVLLLAQVFGGHWILPQVLHLGPIHVRYYGILMATAVAAGWVLAAKRATQYGFTVDEVDNVALWLAVGGFAGARVYHVLSSVSYYALHPVEVFMVWHGGLSIFGALFGGLAALFVYVWYCQRHPLTPSEVSKGAFDTGRVWRWLDLLAPSVLLGQIIGRFGNLFNYEAYGYPTDLPWKMFVPPMFRFSAYAEASFYHPLFLYEAIGNALILFCLLRIADSKWGRSASGAVFISYIILYTVLRFSLEHIRMDSVFLWGDVRENALTSGIMAVVGVSLLVWRIYHVWQKR